MTTLTAPRHTSRRVRGSTLLIAALAVVGISAAVTIPRLASHAQAVTHQQSAGTSDVTPGLVGAPGPAQKGAVRDGGRAEAHQYGGRSTTVANGASAAATVVTPNHRTGDTAERFHDGHEGLG